MASLLNLLPTTPIPGYIPAQVESSVQPYVHSPFSDALLSSRCLFNARVLAR